MAAERTYRVVVTLSFGPTRMSRMHVLRWLISHLVEMKADAPMDLSMKVEPRVNDEDG